MKLRAIKLNKAGQRLEIVIQQLLAQLGRQVCLAIEQKRGDIILERPSAAALIVQESRVGRRAT